MIDDYLMNSLINEAKKEIKPEIFVIHDSPKKVFTFYLNPDDVKRLENLIEIEAQKRNAKPRSMSEVIGLLINIAIKALEGALEAQAEQKKSEGEVDDGRPKCYYCKKPARFVGVHQSSAKEYPLCENHVREVMDKAGDKWLIKPLPSEKAILTEAVTPPGPERFFRLLRDLVLDLILRPEETSAT